MKTVRRYGTRIEAELDQSRLENAEIDSLVVGLGVAMEGGPQGVQLQVADEDAERALSILNEEPLPESADGKDAE